MIRLCVRVVEEEAENPALERGKQKDDDFLFSLSFRWGKKKNPRRSQTDTCRNLI